MVQKINVKKSGEQVLNGKKILFFPLFFTEFAFFYLKCVENKIYWREKKMLFHAFILYN